MHAIPSVCHRPCVLPRWNPDSIRGSFYWKWSYKFGDGMVRRTRAHSVHTLSAYCFVGRVCGHSCAQRVGVVGGETCNLIVRSRQVLGPFPSKFDKLQIEVATNEPIAGTGCNG